MKQKEYFLIGIFIFVFSMSFYVYSYEKTGLSLSPPEDFVGPPFPTSCWGSQQIPDNVPTPNCVGTATALFSGCYTCCEQILGGKRDFISTGKAGECRADCREQQESFLREVCGQKNWWDDFF